MAVKVDKEKCDACWKCMEVCPNESLEKANDGTKDHIRVKEDVCIDCFLCVDECKTGCLQQPE
jgi:NAD-dependent dihydropyrimidine dehydrogenase PreA subunit